MNKTYSITTSQVTKTYGRQTVLAGIDLQVEKGSIFALLGPNGAGKTTMVRVLGTLLQPDSGEAIVEGYDVVHNAAKVREVISLTGQYAAVEELLTGKENLKMIGRLCGLDNKQIKARTDTLLAQFDLEASANKLAKTYSGGMRRKLDLAMSLIASPDVIFLDEPTTGLDPRSRKAMWDIITSLSVSGVTIFLTTQYLEEADQLANRVALIDEGKIVAEGTPGELKKRIGSQYIEVAFETAGDLDTAYALFSPTEATKHTDSTSLRIVTDGSVIAIAKALERVGSSGVSSTAVSLKEPSLDDVFFALTGKQTTKESSDAS
jgi:ABC-2 type transport system ATP-binding protein